MKKFWPIALLLLLTISCKTSEERQEEVKDYEPPWKAPLDKTRNTKSAVENVDKERLRQLEEMDQ